MRNNNCLTNPSLTNELIMTVKGEITYLQWCQRDAERRTRLGRLCTVKIKDGKCWVKAVY